MNIQKLYPECKEYIWRRKQIERKIRKGDCFFIPASYSEYRLFGKLDVIITNI